MNQTILVLLIFIVGVLIVGLGVRPVREKVGASD